MKRIAIVIASLGLAAPAFAGGTAPVVTEAQVITAYPVVSAASDWSGAYGGIQLGYGNLDVKADGIKYGELKGAFAGGQLGYRWDQGTTVWGIEAAITGGDIKSKDLELKTHTRMDLKGQLGYDMGNSLIYATAGGTWAKVKNTVGDRTNVSGWLAGVGYDYQLQNNWTVGGELLYNAYKKNGVKLQGTTFAVRANYRF